MKIYDPYVIFFYCNALKLLKRLALTLFAFCLFVCVCVCIKMCSINEKTLQVEKNTEKYYTQTESAEQWQWQRNVLLQSISLLLFISYSRIHFSH